MKPAPRTKPFSWSYSKLKNFETCPRRHQQVDLLKNFKEDESQALQWGNQLHDAMHKRISKGKELPITMKRYEPWAAGFAKIALTPSEWIKTHTEMKLAIAEDMDPVDFFDRAAWYRCVVDVLVVVPVHRVAIALDWKTGKILEDISQLALTSQVIFAHYPEVEQVASIYAWLGDDAKTVNIYNRSQSVQVWNDIWPRLELMKEAHRTDSYPPTPSGLCIKYCPVKTCQFFEKGSY